MGDTIATAGRLAAAAASEHAEFSRTGEVLRDIARGGISGVVAGIGGTAFLDSSGVDSSQMYFSMAPSALAIVVSMSIVGGRVHGVARSRVVLALLCGGLVSALSILSPLPTSGSPAAIAMRLLPLLAPLVAASIGFVLGTGLSSALRGILVTVAVIGTTSVTLVGNAVATRASQLGERRVEARQLDDRFDAVGRWSRANTNASDVLASNFFCTQAECAGEDWFDEYGQRIIPHRIGPAESLEVGGVRFGAVELALVTERRFLIQGYAWLWTYGEPPAWLEERVELSVGFANSPTEDEHRRLVEAGVDWFVVDLRLTETREWLPTTPVVYDDGKFVVLRLVPAT